MLKPELLAALRTVADDADSYLDDLRTGVDEGVYDRTPENVDRLREGDAARHLVGAWIKANDAPRAGWEVVGPDGERAAFWPRDPDQPHAARVKAQTYLERYADGYEAREVGAVGTPQRTAADLLALLVPMVDHFPSRDYWRRMGKLPELETLLDDCRAVVLADTGERLPKRRR